MIHTENLTKSFGPFLAVNGVSLDIHEEEVVGLLGPNGAGKTTTMRMITGFLRPTSGSVQIGGLDATQNAKDVRNMIGYLPESAPLYEEMRVLDYLRFMAEMRGVESSRIKERLKYVVSVCGLGRMLSKTISELSKGYKQRTGLAATLLHDPKILILDEPTSGLDPNQIQEIRGLIKDIGKEKTVILSTHILQEVKAMCSRVFIMSDGKIVAAGSEEELQSRHAKAHKVEVHIEGPKDAVKSSLQSLEGVRSITSAPTGKGSVHGFMIEADGKHDLRPIIFELSAKSKWTLYEMHRKDLDLEELFATLTTSTS